MYRSIFGLEYSEEDIDFICEHGEAAFDEQTRLLRTAASEALIERDERDAEEKERFCHD